MKNSFIIFCLVWLSGCIGYIPQYYDSEITDVPIYGLKITKDVKAYVDGKPAEITTLGRNWYFNKGHNFEWDAYCVKNKKKCYSGGNLPKIRVNRLKEDRELTLTRPGYKDLHFVLKRQLTDEKWAHGTAELFVIGDMTAAVMLVPSNTLLTLYAFGKSIGYIPEDALTGTATSSLALVGLPAAMGVDVYNLLIGLPSTAVVNPWFNYRLEPDPYKQAILWEKADK